MRRDPIDETLDQTDVRSQIPGRRIRVAVDDRRGDLLVLLNGISIAVQLRNRDSPEPFQVSAGLAHRLPRTGMAGQFDEALVQRLVLPEILFDVARTDRRALPRDKEQ